MTRLVWRRIEDDRPPGGFYANVPKGLVVDAATGDPASRVWRWPVGRDAWRVSLGVVAGPRGPKLQCSDLGMAVAVAEDLVEHGKVACHYGDDGNGFCTVHPAEYHDRATPPCSRCGDLGSEYSTEVDGVIVELCQACQDVVEADAATTAAENELADALIASLEKLAKGGRS